MSVIHTYKTWPSFFGAILNGTKTFEVRKDDRDPAPQVGDWLELREYEPGFERYTDRLVRLEISYVLRDSEHFPFPGYIVIGFKNPNIAAEVALREKAERERDALAERLEMVTSSREAMADDAIFVRKENAALRLALSEAKCAVKDKQDQIDAMREALEKIANQDYRGNRSIESQIAFAALARYSEIKEKP